MPLLHAFLQDAAPFNVWIAARTDGLGGSGTAQDPHNGAARLGHAIPVVLNNVSREATAITGTTPHGLVDGDVVTIASVTGLDAGLWNGTFGIYGVTPFSFKYLLRKALFNPPLGNATVTRLTFPFDEVMRNAPPNIQIRLGPGTYLTRGFASNDSRGWEPKSGQKIIGAGMDVTTLQLVGAENADQHYHTIGMPIEPSGTTAIAALESFEVADLTIDSNLDNQPGRPTPGYAVALRIDS
jgi:hypothetical protein